MAKSNAMDFLTRLRGGLADCGLCRKKLLIAVSGGADSVALLRGLHGLSNEIQLGLAVGHFNHRLRGTQSDEDAAWLQTLCDELSLPFFSDACDVAEQATSTGRGIEEAARMLRYDWLAKVAALEGLDAVVTGHTADDQVETILNHLLRGSGLAGLRAMKRQRLLEHDIPLVRPLLSATRRDVLEYLAAINQDFREDATNDDLQIMRNRIRHELLPLLRERFNPNVAGVLQQLGQQAAEAQEVIELFASRMLDRALREQTAGRCRLELGELRSAPRHLVRACFVELWTRQNWPRQKMGFQEWDRLAELTHSSGTFDLPGAVTATVRGQLMMCERRCE